jgi:hypothetical protein
MPTDPPAVRLIAGPDRPPALRVGDRAFCHLRNTAVVVTAISDARLPWPRCRALDSVGGSGLLVDDELVRAIRTEAAIAVAFWWNVPPTSVSRWERLLGVGRYTPGRDNARIEWGDTIHQPMLLADDKLMKFEVVVPPVLSQRVLSGEAGPGLKIDERLGLCGTRRLPVRPVAPPASTRRNSPPEEAFIVETGP